MQGYDMFAQPKASKASKAQWKKTIETNLWDDDEGTIIFTKKSPMSSPQSVMHFEGPLITTPFALPPARRTLEYTPSPPPIEDKLEALLAEEVGISQARLPIKPEGGRHGKAKSRSLMSKFWARKRQEKAKARRSVEAEEADEADETEEQPVRKPWRGGREKARRGDRRAAMTAKCSFEEDASSADIFFGERPVTVVFRICPIEVVPKPLPTLVEHVEAILEGEVDVSYKQLGVKEAGGRRDKVKSRSLMSKFWARKRQEMAKARLSHAAPEEADETDEQPVRMPWRGGREKARRCDRRAAMTAKCGFEEDASDAIVYFGEPPARKKVYPPKIYRVVSPRSVVELPSALPPGISQVRSFKLMDFIVDRRGAKADKRKLHARNEKQWAKHRQAKALKLRAELENGKGDTPPSARTQREKSRRAQRRDANAAKCAPDTPRLSFS